MNTQATTTSPIPLVSASPVGEEEKADLDLILGAIVLACDWHAIRQCLRCLTQGKAIDCGPGEDDKPFVRDLTAGELNARAAGPLFESTPGREVHRSVVTGRQAVRTLVALARREGISALEAARRLAFTPAALTARAEWDAWHAKVEADRVERRKLEAEKANAPKE